MASTGKLEYGLCTTCMAQGSKECELLSYIYAEQSLANLRAELIAEDDPISILEILESQGDLAIQELVQTLKQEAGLRHCAIFLSAHP